ncbi:MAG: hypothetical protein IKT46_00105 [Clostridia bacterium]|nr:hypothetical protein [Clostridia bacterium]
MGRLLGAHDSDELDRPDLNKCPDCGCFFPQDNCPLCGKECPEAFRAGNRKKVKHKKHKNSSGRVRFVEWYHSWWFIAIMMVFMPVIGIILLLTSPHKKGIKITLVVIAAVYFLVTTFGIGSIVSRVTNIFSEPVERLPYEEYTQKCDTVTPEDFYRSPNSYKGDFVCLELKVKSKFVDLVGYYDGLEYNTYYVCTDTEYGDIEIIVRDCQKELKNYKEGDIIAVYGEGAGMDSFDDLNYEYHQGPCIFAAYIEIKN